MFHEARIKLTAWYLIIIMGVSLSFSGVMYFGVNRELERIGNSQKTRIQGLIRGYPVSIDVPIGPDFDAIAQARLTFLTTLALINLTIFIVSGLGGYFLAGQTLEPIAKMMKEQKEFVSNASHELRTPLTSLMTEIEVALRDKEITLNDTKNLLVSNLEEVKKMNNLSNYLLSLNKLQDGKLLTKTTPVDLKPVVENVVKKLEALALKKKIHIKTNLKNSIIKGNQAALEELVTILLDNAIKYSNSGGKILITTTSKKVLKVADEGIGIPRADLPHIFDRFYRAEYSRNKEKTDGYGLGLSIAKSIIDIHKASVRVKSEVGKGTTFTVTF